MALVTYLDPAVLVPLLVLLVWGVPGSRGLVVVPWWSEGTALGALGVPRVVAYIATKNTFERAVTNVDIPVDAAALLPMSLRAMWPAAHEAHECVSWDAAGP